MPIAKAAAKLAVRTMHSSVLQGSLAVPRRGVMLHYDDSASDASSLEWFRDMRCRNGYTWLVLDDGRIVELADPGARTPHAGVCLTPDANSRFYGIAAATNGRVIATAAQVAAMVELCVWLFQRHEWPGDGAASRLVGHDEQAIWTKEATRAAGIADADGEVLWGKLGRKIDPRGNRRDGIPIIDIEVIRRTVAKRLGRSTKEGT
jgi:N-acetyl-anhydromuramyl-L-alanine amidase AmpD